MPEDKPYGEPPYTVTVDGRSEPGTFPTQDRAVGEMTRLSHKYPGRKVVVLDAQGTVVAEANQDAPNPSA
jgi:hypothetical protein